MNLKQMRQTLEQVLGYYDYLPAVGGGWAREPREDAPGFYYQQGALIGPAFYVMGRQRVPSNWDVKGLEATLVEVPRPKTKMSIGMVETTQIWTLYLQQYDKEKTILEPQLQVLRHFGGSAKPTYWQQDDVRLSDRAMIQIETVDYDLPNYPTDASLGEVPSPIENSPFSTFFDQ